MSTLEQLEKVAKDLFDTAKEATFENAENPLDSLAMAIMKASAFEQATIVKQSIEVCSRLEAIGQLIAGQTEVLKKIEGRMEQAEMERRVLN